MKKIIISLIFGLIAIIKISAATFTVTSVSNSGPGTFRQAILDANALPGLDNVNFAIGTGAKTITLTAIVNVTSAINIDGSTQPGFAGTPLITISGSSVFRLTNVNGAIVKFLNFTGNSGSTSILANTISNCEFSNIISTGAAFAFRLDGDNTNNVITNNNFSGATAYGILFSLGINNGNTVTNNNLTNCAFRGLYYGLGTPASIENNDFTASVNALFLGGATNFTLTSPTGSGPNKNIFGGHTGRVLELFDNTNLNISNWDFTTLVVAPLSNRSPLFVRNSTANVFDNCNLAGMDIGLRLDDDNTNTIINNCNFSGAINNGIEFNGGNNQGNIITNNNLSNCGSYGLYYFIGTPSSVNSNTFTGSTNGIYLKGANTFTLGSSNVFKNQTGSSINLESCSLVNILNIATNGVGGHGIIINQSNNCVIDGNSSCGRLYGVRIKNSSNMNSVINSNIVSCTTGIFIEDFTTNDTYINNVNLFNKTNIVNSGSNSTITNITTTNNTPLVTVNSGTICSGQSFTMVPNGAVSYSFSGGSAVVSPTITTSYSVVGTDANGCVSAVPAISTIPVFGTPVVSVNSGVICSGQSFTMTPSSAGIVTYYYSSGSAIVTPSASTTYSVIGITNFGCVSSNTAVSSVTVNITPTVSVNSGAICIGQTFTMVPSGADTYTYSSGSSVVSPSINVSYNVVGTSSLGCVSSNTAISTVTVNSLPLISVNSGSICIGESFTMTPSGASTYTYSSGSAVVTPTLNSSYDVTGTDSNGCIGSNTAVSSITVNALPTISVNSGSICAGQSFTITPSGASTYTYSSGSAVVTPTLNSSYDVTGTDANGCIGSNTAVSSVIVNALPTISVNSGSICAGQSFTITPSGASTYTYSSGSEVVLPSANANYTITGADVNGCENSAISSITVNALPTISVNSGSICAGQSFTMTPSGASTYTYSSGSAVVTPTLNSSYDVTGTDANGCIGSNTAISSITVNALPNIMAMTTHTLLCVGETATLSVMGASTYTWSTAENTADIAVTPTAQTTYTVIGTDVNECVNSATIVQDVSLCTGLYQIASVDNDLSVYPNPSNGNFNIKVTSLSQVTILNLLGKVIYAGQLEVGVNSINLNQFANGIYLLKSESNGRAKTVRLIKE